MFRGEPRRKIGRKLLRMARGKDEDVGERNKGKYDGNAGLRQKDAFTEQTGVGRSAVTIRHLERPKEEEEEIFSVFPSLLFPPFRPLSFLPLTDDLLLGQGISFNYPDFLEKVGGFPLQIFFFSLYTSPFYFCP